MGVLCLVVVQSSPASVINVRELGAKGDGVADDTEIFQKALDSLEKTGGTVFVPAGDYRITKRLLISGDHASVSKPINNIELIGESQVASRLLGDGVDYILGAKTILGKDNKRSPIFGTVISRLTFAQLPTWLGASAGRVGRIVHVALDPASMCVRGVKDEESTHVTGQNERGNSRLHGHLHYPHPEQRVLWV